MRTSLVVVCAAALLAVSAPAYTTDRRAECHKVKQQIRKIESRMRQGYSHRQGERYNERLRELKAKRSKLCR